MKTVVCQSISAGVTQAYAEKIITSLTTGGLLLLEGELGAGKTTFVQGLARALRIQQSVTSPTFTLMNVYETAHPVIKQLVHLDLYRLTDEEETSTLDIASWLSQPNVLVVVEWPERAPALWPEPLGTIRFVLGDGVSDRSLTVSGTIADYF